MQVSLADFRSCGANRHKRALLSNQLRSSNPLFLFKEKKKFLPLTATQRSDRKIVRQLIREKVMIQQFTDGHQLSSGERV